MVAMLDGVKVLDFTQVLSGPTATRYLAEMGAEVVKVEAPKGDLTRFSPTVRDGRSGYFINANRGKRSVCIDLKDARGVELIKAMVGDFDVVVENFSPGTIDRIGLGWDVLSALNPRLIMCSISGFGHTGALATLPGYDGAAQAYAGITSLTGDAADGPMMVGAPVGDVLTGANGVAGILAALFWRERSGEGQHLTTSVLASYLQAHDTAIESYSVSGGEFVQPRNGRVHPLVCPYGIFETGDGWVFIAAAADRHWIDLCTAMERGDLLDPAHPWNDRRTREAARPEVNEVVGRWMRAQESRSAALVPLQQHRVPCGPVLSVDEVVEDSDLRESGAITMATDPVLGELYLPGFPLRSSATDIGFDTEAPFLGEHNAEVLAGPAGGPAALAELIANGVVIAEPAGPRPSRQR